MDWKGYACMKIKICGLTREQDIQAVNQWKPDYIGFVYAEKSRRYVSRQQAARLKKNLSPDIQAVGVFVNESKEKIVRLFMENTIDIAQLHGQETEEEISWIKEQTGKPVIKAISVNAESDVQYWQNSCADYLLFDNGTGGTGLTFDWHLIKENKKPYFLAGGIGLHNITDAMKQKAYAIDLSGGVETDGQKDPKKIAEIVQIARRYRR